MSFVCLFNVHVYILAPYCEKSSLNQAMRGHGDHTLTNDKTGTLFEPIRVNISWSMSSDFRGVSLYAKL